MRQLLLQLLHPVERLLPLGHVAHEAGKEPNPVDPDLPD